MEEKFLAALASVREQAEKLGVRIRPLDLAGAKRCLSSHRVSDGFDRLAQLGRLDLSLEALAVKKPYTALFSDEEANNALDRLLSAGSRFS